MSTLGKTFAYVQFGKMMKDFMIKHYLILILALNIVPQTVFALQDGADQEAVETTEANFDIPECDQLYCDCDNAATERLDYCYFVLAGVVYDTCIASGVPSPICGEQAHAFRRMCDAVNQAENRECRRKRDECWANKEKK